MLKQSGQFQGGPQKNNLINWGLRVVLAVEVFDFRSRTIIHRSCAYCNGHKTGAIVPRIVRFPRLATELKPCPRTYFISFRLMQYPQVSECGSRVAT